ncbi:MAG: bifunctional glutamate N-acetyltransferase/amino-acid acetyltransferase ArgJ [Coriobacteriales bacterium]|jgi:glutamate N-acetyltransferase/amino-acid N-acetyltransferase|nr:bifunctional glutamate N-acetyltransferase/amino-acid acetyltransferase ArgJ [Coriobacteriales bacterium]
MAAEVLAGGQTAAELAAGAQTAEAQTTATRVAAGLATGSVVAAQPGTVVGNATFVEGGLGAVKGLRCAGVSAGFRRNPARRDLALVVTEKPAVATGVFTRNRFCAAPVVLSRQHLAQLAMDDVEAPAPDTGARAIVLNSGNANAATGEPGMQSAVESARIVAEHVGCKPHQVLVASTGVIGAPFAAEPFITGVPLALAELGAADGTAHASGLAAAAAIMTTDTHPKQAAVTFTATQSDGVEVTYTIGGMVKGSGMIQPDMATLLGVLATDLWLTQEAAELALRQVMDVTLNKVTIDSDTSTNDTVYLLATGGTEGKTINPTCPLFEPFVSALRVLCEDLARQIAADGEGATRLITVNVTGAADDTQADLAARAVANSPLVKTAVAGHDANWGRIAMAIGKSGAAFRQEDVNISIMGLSVCEGGLTVPFDEDEALRRFEEYTEIVIDVGLGAGEGRARLWTCDLTHDYIAINGDYRT